MDRQTYLININFPLQLTLNGFSLRAQYWCITELNFKIYDVVGMVMPVNFSYLTMCCSCGFHEKAGTMFNSCGFHEKTPCSTLLDFMRKHCVCGFHETACLELVNFIRKHYV